MCINSRRRFCGSRAADRARLVASSAKRGVVGVTGGSVPVQSEAWDGAFNRGSARFADGTNIPDLA
jgi:hypothetical protein